MTTTPSKRLETFANPHPERDYTVRIRVPEFTCLCPKTGQPDFGRVILRYGPAAVCIELKSLKLYYQSYRDEGIFYEAVTNRIRDDLAAALSPKWLQIVTEWRPRGGIQSRIIAVHGAVPAEWARG